MQLAMGKELEDLWFVVKQIVDLQSLADDKPQKLEFFF
jgi:hypothetical protein